MKSDQLRMLEYARDGKSISADELIHWNCHWRIDKYDGVPHNYDQPEKWARWKQDRDSGLQVPNRILEGTGNLLLTVGVTDLWNALVTSAASMTVYNATNAAIAVGDSSTAASAGQTDLQAAAGAAIQTSGFTSVTNATPQVIVNGSGSWTVTPLVGQVVTISGITTDTQINNTWECQATTNATTVTALNSTAGGVAGALASGVMKIINRYIQTVNAIPTVSTNQIQFVSVFASANANFAWNEFAITNSAATTNKQAAPPAPHMMNRAVATMGTKASGAAWTITETITLT